MASYPSRKPIGSEDSTVDPDETLSPELVEDVLTDTIDAYPSSEEEMPEVSGSMPTLSVLGPSIVIEGKLVAKENLLIQGRIDGSIKHTATHLTIGAHGNVKGNVSGQKVIVQGCVQGDIRSKESVVVEPSAQVRGNIFAPRVGLKEGAKFKGDIDMGLDDRDAKNAAKAAGRTKSNRS